MHKNGLGALALYSQTVVWQFSYDIDTSSLAIHDASRTCDWHEHERKSATYLHMPYDRHR